MILGTVVCRRQPHLGAAGGLHRLDRRRGRDGRWATRPDEAGRVGGAESRPSRYFSSAPPGACYQAQRSRRCPSGFPANPGPPWHGSSPTPPKRLKYRPEAMCCPCLRPVRQPRQVARDRHQRRGAADFLLCSIPTRWRRPSKSKSPSCCWLTPSSRLDWLSTKVSRREAQEGLQPVSIECWERCLVSLPRDIDLSDVKPSDAQTHL